LKTPKNEQVIHLPKHIDFPNSDPKKYIYSWSGSLIDLISQCPQADGRPYERRNLRNYKRILKNIDAAETSHTHSFEKWFNF